MRVCGLVRSIQLSNFRKAAEITTSAKITTYELIPYLYYPMLMAVCAIVFIFLFPQRGKGEEE